MNSIILLTFRKLYIFIACVGFISFAQAQQDTALVHLNDLSFTSELEKKSFSNFFEQNDKDYLALFLALDEGVTNEDYQSYYNLLSKKIEQIDREKFDKKSPKKKIKYIYSLIHDGFLKKYELENHFSSIFKNGFYNCVSGSALYALVFDKLGIPYLVKEKPTHVYLMAYPDSERILIEPTDPRSGYMMFNTAYKTTFIENLKAAKIISTAEARNNTIDQLFDKYYFIDEKITINELVGIQYANDALYRIARKDMEGAYSQLEKAYLFYSKEKVKSLLLALTADILSRTNYADAEDADYLARFSKFKDYGITNENILAEFARANNEILIDKNDTALYRQFYKRLIGQINEEELQKEISFFYNYENGRVLYNKGLYKNAIPYLERAYEEKPTNQDINNIYIATIANTVERISDNKRVLEELEGYKDKAPGLMENNNFKSMLVSAYLVQTVYAYDLNKPEEGNKYKDLFKLNYSKNLSIDTNLIGRAFGNAAVYYFRKGNKLRAINLLNEGLSISPNNHELLIRKQMIR